MRNYFKHLKFAILSFHPKYRDKLFNRLFTDRLKNTLHDLQSKGVNLNTIYDIGARHAEWSTHLKPAFSTSNFILFEANESCIPFLSKSGFKYFIGTLSSEKKIVRFFQNNSTGDSYYKEATSYYDKVLAVDKQTNTLECLVTEEQLPPPNLIKIDTQGSELDILKGGIHLLKHASLIYLECPVLPYNTGAPSFDAYISFLQSNGFIPYEICDTHHLNNALVQIDILFISNAALSALNTSSEVKLHFV